MSLKTTNELNKNMQLKKGEPTGRTIGRANARLITAEEANAVGGGLCPTSSICVWCCGCDCGGCDA